MRVEEKQFPCQALDGMELGTSRMLTSFLIHEFPDPVTSLSPFQRAGLRGKEKTIFRKREELRGQFDEGLFVCFFCSLFFFFFALLCLPWNRDFYSFRRRRSVMSK